MSRVLPKNMKPKKTPLAKPVNASEPRRLKAPKRRLYKPSTWRRPKPVYAPISKSRHILKRSIRNSWQSRKAIGGVTLVYGIGVILLVRGFFSNQDFTVIKQTLDSILTGTTGKIESTLIQLTTLFSSNNTISTTTGGIYQTILLIICSLAIIWIFRQSQAKKPVSMKAAFYQGMYPIIPFLLVLLVVTIQLLPLLTASYLFKALISNGVAVLWWEIMISYVVICTLAYSSLRMLTSSIFAFYIVTLPGMAPLQALRSARNLVFGRRLLIWRKFLLLPFVLVVATSLLVLPFMFIFTSVVSWLFFILSVFWFSISHGYLYTLYRELIKDA